MATHATRTTPFVKVVCEDCGIDFQLSVRNELAHRRKGTPHRCQVCRLPGTQPSRDRVEEAKAWWLERFTLDELRNWPEW